jgi:hypothetical protein
MPVVNLNSHFLIYYALISNNNLISFVTNML